MKLYYSIRFKSVSISGISAKAHITPGLYQGNHGENVIWNDRLQNLSNIRFQ